MDPRRRQKLKWVLYTVAATIVAIAIGANFEGDVVAEQVARMHASVDRHLGRGVAREGTAVVTARAPPETRPLAKIAKIAKVGKANPTVGINSDLQDSYLCDLCDLGESTLVPRCVIAT